MTPEEGKAVLKTFFKTLEQSVSEIDTTNLAQGGSFSDIQLKKVMVHLPPAQPKLLYCLSFVLVTEDEAKRREAQALLSTINQVIGKPGPGYRRTEPRYRLYSGDEQVAETE